MLSIQYRWLLCYVLRWFYGDITADHAKQLLTQAGNHRSFLVRTRQTAADQFALSVRLGDDVHHVVVVCQVRRFLM